MSISQEREEEAGSGSESKLLCELKHKDESCTKNLDNKLTNRQQSSVAATRVLRSATRGKVPQHSEKRKKCHICRERMEDFKLATCLNYACCHCTFCTQCLERHFKGRLKKERIKKSGEKWVCFVCRGICQCERCRDDIMNELILLKSGLSANKGNVL